MDQQQAINHFLSRFQSLSRLPLVTDEEMERLFPAEVNAAMAELDAHNAGTGTCTRCTSRCCKLASCELYEPTLGGCPIFRYRPALCRMHYCPQYGDGFRETIIAVGDIFLNSLTAGEAIDKDRIRLFDSPPLKLHAPGLVAALLPLIQAFREGRLDRQLVFALAEKEAAAFRTKMRDCS